MKEEQNETQQPATPRASSKERPDAREQSKPQTVGQNSASTVEEAERAAHDHEGEGTGAHAGEYS